MVEVVSALAGQLVPGRQGVAKAGGGLSFREISGRDLVEVAWWPDTEIMVKGALARELGFVISEASRMATGIGQSTAFPVAPDKVWVAGPEIARLARRLGDVIAPVRGSVTELGHAHAILRLAGPSARDVLARHLAVDLDPAVFTPGCFALTAMHQATVLLHAVRDMAGADSLELYLPRSFAASLFERLRATAQGFGYAIDA